MYFIIVGGGKIGYALAQLLLEEEAEVVVVEKDEEKAQKIANDLDIIAITDDATKEDILEQAGVRSADAVIALTESDEVNIAIGMLAKEKGAKKVVVRLAKTNYNKAVLDKIGIDVAIHPEAAAAAYIEEMLVKPDVLDLAFLTKGDAEIQELLVTKDSQFCNKKVKQIDSEKSKVVAVYINDKLTFPTPESVLKDGNRVLVITQRKISEEGV